MNKPIPTCRDPWARWAKIIFAIVVCATLLAVSGCDNTPRRQMVLTDEQSGCQYVGSARVAWKYNAELEPRMDRNGKQVCK